jgi:hypothetical protein
MSVEGYGGGSDIQMFIVLLNTCLVNNITWSLEGRSVFFLTHSLNLVKAL